MHGHGTPCIGRHRRSSLARSIKAIYLVPVCTPCGHSTPPYHRRHPSSTAYATNTVSDSVHRPPPLTPRVLMGEGTGAGSEHLKVLSLSAFLSYRQCYLPQWCSDGQRRQEGGDSLHAEDKAIYRGHARPIQQRTATRACQIGPLSSAPGCQAGFLQQLRLDLSEASKPLLTV